MLDTRARTDDWFFQHRHEIIRCPYQPGNLLISKHSCRKRRARADKEHLTDMMTGDISTYIFKKGLAICRDCKIGSHRPLNRQRSSMADEGRMSA